VKKYEVIPMKSMKRVYTIGYTICPTLFSGNMIFRPARINRIGQNLNICNQIPQGTMFVVFSRNRNPIDTRNIAPVMSFLFSICLLLNLLHFIYVIILSITYIFSIYYGKQADI